MSKKPLETLTETMFYVLMAFYRQEMCGTEIARYVRELTKGEVSMGPGTLYTILSLEKTGSEGRKITYAITERGRRMYQSELRRLRRCLADAEAAGAERGKL